MVVDSWLYFTIASTVVSNSFAILYKLSPRFTVYTIYSLGFGGSFTPGITSFSPMFKRFDVKLLAAFNSDTVILNLFAIL